MKELSMNNDGTLAVNVYEPRETVVINLFGGPNTGKSTLQADLYSYMKKAGYRVEMVREVAKKWAWGKTEITPLDQLNIIGEQIKDESDLYGKVDYIITDSPIMLGAFYMDHNHGELFMQDMVRQYMDFAEKNGVIFKNILLTRKGIPYDPSGRFENKYQLEILDDNLKAFIVEARLDFDTLICHPEERVDTVRDILFWEEEG